MAFKVRSDRKETVNKTIRFPLELTEQIEEAIIGKDATFSGFVIQACHYALESIEDEREREICLRDHYGSWCAWEEGCM